MVCIYCRADTRVTNSRLQKRQNSTWRRRQCSKCRAIFTTIEHAEYENALVIKNHASHIVPFSRDTLFVSIFDSCRHRDSPVRDAGALTDTILAKMMLGLRPGGMIERNDLIAVAAETLRQFDTAAYTYYQAYHKRTEGGAIRS